MNTTKKYLSIFMWKDADKHKQFSSEIWESDCISVLFSISISSVLLNRFSFDRKQFDWLRIKMIYMYILGK